MANGLFDIEEKEPSEAIQMVRMFRGARTKEDFERLRKSVARTKAFKERIRSLEAERAAKSERVPDEILPEAFLSADTGRALWKERMLEEDFQGAATEIVRILSNKKLKLNEKQRFNLETQLEKMQRAAKNVERIEAEAQQEVPIPSFKPPVQPPFLPRPAVSGADIPPEFRSPKPIRDPFKNIRFEGSGIFG
jgi:hypothetical protein